SGRFVVERGAVGQWVGILRLGSLGLRHFRSAVASGGRSRSPSRSGRTGRGTRATRAAGTAGIAGTAGPVGPARAPRRGAGTARAGRGVVVLHQRIAHDPARIVLARVEFGEVQVLGFGTELLLQRLGGPPGHVPQGSNQSAQLLGVFRNARGPDHHRRDDDDDEELLHVQLHATSLMCPGTHWAPPTRAPPAHRIRVPSGAAHPGRPRWAYWR